jgi:hypothetical protein
LLQRRVCEPSVPRWEMGPCTWSTRRQQKGGEIGYPTANLGPTGDQRAGSGQCENPLRGRAGGDGERHGQIGLTEIDDHGLDCAGAKKRG